MLIKSKIIDVLVLKKSLINFVQKNILQKNATFL